MTSTAATRPANLRAYRKEDARRLAELDTARAVVASFDAFLALAPNPSGAWVSEAVGAAWNAAHDMVTALEAEYRAFDLNGYGKPVERTALADLVAANID